MAQVFFIVRVVLASMCLKGDAYIFTENMEAERDCRMTALVSSSNAFEFYGELMMLKKKLYE